MTNNSNNNNNFRLNGLNPLAYLGVNPEALKRIEALEAKIGV